MNRVFAFGVLAAASCASPREAPLAPAPTAVLPAPVATVAPPPVNDAGPRVPLDMPTLDLPPVVACTLRVPLWTPPTALRFRAGGPPFAQVAGSDAAVLLGAGQPAHAVLDLEAHGVRIRGAIDAADVPLHARDARLVAGVLVPLPSQRLLWEGAAGTAVTASFLVDDSVHVAAGSRVQLSGACDELGLEPGHYDGFGAVGGLGLNQPMRIPTKKAVALSSTAGGPASARLDVEGEDWEAAVVVVERKGPYARVVWRGRDQLAVGWLRASMLLPGVGSPGFLGKTVVAGSATPRLRIGSRQACAHEVLLVAEAGGELRTVGRIAAGTEIDTVVDDVPPGATLIHVDLPQTSLRATSGARLLVERTNLAGCEETERAQR